MSTITFDTHEFVKTLETAGVSTAQAEATATAFKNAQQQSELATKADITLLRADLREMELRLTIRLGGMMAAAIAAIAALNKLL